MNSLSENRDSGFQDVTPPPSGSVFHHRRELLWMIREYLDESRRDANARSKLYDYLHSQLEMRLNGYSDGSQRHPGYLYPTTASPTRNRQQIFYEAWNDLANAILIAAERLWRDEFLDNKTDADVKGRFRNKRGNQDGQAQAAAEAGHFELLCQQSRLIMHLYLQTTLYRIRAMQNVRAGEAVLRPARRKDRIEGRVARLIKNYARTLASWERQIRHVTGLHFFELQYGDIQWFRALSKEFGLSSVHVEETGWITLAADAGDELHYQYLKARMYGNLQARHLMIGSFQWLLEVTTGFGKRPARLVGTGIATVVVFSVSFFLNDWVQSDAKTGLHFCPASGSASLTWWEVIVKYLYVGISNLSSLGSDSSVAQICDTTILKVLLIGSSIFGYFLLGMLAALVIQVITERD